VVRRIFGGVVGDVPSSLRSKLRLRLPLLDGIDKSVSTDVMDVVRDVERNKEFCRVEGTEDSVSVSTTRFNIGIMKMVRSTAKLTILD
jgi:hypothetical protein